MSETGASGAISAVHAAAYDIPTETRESDGTDSWESTTLVVAEATAQGRAGLGWTYGPAVCADYIERSLAPLARGSDPLRVGAVFDRMVRAVRNDGRPGAIGYALSAVDAALWDLKARILGVSLAVLLGAIRGEAPLYWSGGFVDDPDDRLREQLEDCAQGQGVPRVKIKIGQDGGRAVGRDLARIAIARESIGDAELYVDANGAYSRKQAVRVAQSAQEHRIGWFEEPVSSDDLAGLREVRDRVDPDVAAGEYGHDVQYFQRMCAAGAVDCLQVDASRCGGATEWARAAAVAASHGLDVSAHCAPNLHAHLAVATPNFRHLEWFQPHVRVESRYFDGALVPCGGLVAPDLEAPGTGLALKNADLAQHRV